MRERYELAKGRIAEIIAEQVVTGSAGAFFKKTASFLLEICDEYELIEDNVLWSATREDLAENNKRLYEDILPGHYNYSYANPDVACAKLGKDIGPYLCALQAELRGMIVYAFEKDLPRMVIRMELFLEMYSAFVVAAQDSPKGTDMQVSKETLHEILYYYLMDYAWDEAEHDIRAMVDPSSDFAKNIIMNEDLTDLKYLYRFGEYVSDNELDTARHLNHMSEDELQRMADTFTEGYRIGFEVTGKDISIKKTVTIYYVLGFEQMIRRAIVNFEKLGLEVTLMRAPMTLFSASRVKCAGYMGAHANRQYEYDHKDDIALVLDKKYIARKLEAREAALKKYEKECRLLGGPAVLEVFGEFPFNPETKKTAPSLGKRQQKLSVEYAMKAGMIQNQYIPGEERSFTIIAFPVPEIGVRYPEIFDEVMKINTLDYKLYQGIQQTIIDALDRADYVHVVGMNGNRTDLKVALHKKENPETESNFENCVADVNIPLGEVFTSPRLKQTDGLLHVTSVYLNGLLYRDLSIQFKDGCTTEYSCANFESESENQKYIKDNVLFHHDFLPMGEFAIGTNTMAYRVGREYDIAKVLPILIAEKTGPHFALGDTCYSHEEEVESFNPDGKKLVAKENDFSALRDTEPEKAYFNCHLDITIPYDELGSLTAVSEDGEETAIIENGKFVLAGCEELNKELARTSNI